MTTERRKQPPLVGQPDAGDGAFARRHRLGYAGDRMKTLLGSCVAVILTDQRRTVGTMCHIVHVGRPTMPTSTTPPMARWPCRPCLTG